MNQQKRNRSAGRGRVAEHGFSCQVKDLCAEFDPARQLSTGMPDGWRWLKPLSAPLASRQGRRHHAAITPF